MNSRVRSRGGNGLPSTAMASLAVTSSAGELMTRPLTVTRPCVIHSSASRREARPARDTTLAMRSPDFLTRGGCGARLSNSGCALAIGATAAERRTFCKNLAVVLVLAARPIVTRFAARMLLPVGAAFGPSRVALRSLAGTVEFRAILARTRKARTLLAAAVVARPIKARLVEIARAVAGGTGIALAAILALLPRL